MTDASGPIGDRLTRKHGTCRPTIPPALSSAVYEKTYGGKISCRAAFEVAGGRETTPAAVGIALDCLGVSIEACQLGLFGYSPQWRIVPPASAVRADLGQAIQGQLAGGRLPCSAAWRIAAEFKVPRMDVAAVCEHLGIKVSACQLGAF